MGVRTYRMSESFGLPGRPTSIIIIKEPVEDRMKEKENHQKSQSEKKKDEKEVLELFNTTKVEPFNFTRQIRCEEECLSYL